MNKYSVRFLDENKNEFDFQKCFARNVEELLRQLETNIPNIEIIEIVEEKENGKDIK